MTRLERAQANVEHWREQAAQVERERRNMIWALRVGIPAGIATAIFYHGWIGFGVCALSLLTYVMGVYMTSVRRIEFAEAVQLAEAELAAARKVS